MNRWVKILLGGLLIIGLCFVFSPGVLAVINFSISNPIVGSGDEIEVDVTITGLTSSSNCSTGGCYLQAEILSAGGAFGYTFNNSEEFIDFFQPSSTDEIKSKLFNFVPVAGSWSGKLKAKNNPESKLYYGPGVYLLVFRRFTGNSKTPTSGDSNSLSISLTANIPAPTSVPTPIATPSPSDSPTPIALKTAPPSPTPIKSPTPSPTPKKTAVSTPTPTSEILGIASDSGTPENIYDLRNSPNPSPDSLPDNSQKKFPLISIIFVVSGVFLIGISGYLAYRKQKQKPPDILNE